MNTKLNQSRARKATRPSALTLALVFGLSGCANVQNGADQMWSGFVKGSPLDPKVKAQRAKEDEESGCTKTYSKEILTVVGVVGGALIGSQIGGGNGRKLAEIGLAAAGGLAGNYIGAELDRRHCELERLATKNKIDMAGGEVSLKPRSEIQSMTAQDTSQNSIGTKDTNLPQALIPKSTRQNAIIQNPTVEAVTADVIEFNTEGQFTVGSSELNKHAQAFFNSVAKQYNAKIAAQSALSEAEYEAQKRQAALRDADKKKVFNEVYDSHNLRPILLVGHTDDTGDSQMNQELSEHRAKNVALLFENAGIPKSRLYYRGAGDTDPIADNNTENGRAKNRRVEIVELDSKTALQNYIALKQIDPTMYRSKKATKEIAATIKEEDEKKSSKRENTQQILSTKENQYSISSEAEIARTIPLASGGIDFGGSSSSGTVDKKIKMSLGDPLKPEKSIASKFGSIFISEVNASNENAYTLPCTLDAPHYGGKYVSLDTGKPVHTSTADYLPGLYQTSWVGAINRNYLGLTPVAVLRDNYESASKPTMYIYSNVTTLTKDSKASALIPLEVNVYPGEKGILYRVYAKGKSPFICADIVVPNKAPFQVKAGELYYSRSGTVFNAPFEPKMLHYN